MKARFAVASLAVMLALSLVTIAGEARALLIGVSQESAAGAGDFDANVLGSIDPFQTGLNIANFYQYNVPNAASYNGELNGGPLPISSLSQSFFVLASNGLHYVTVHDNPNDGTGGSTRMTTVLVGGAGGSTVFSVEDDPAEGTAISDVAGDRIFDTVHGWSPCCTDGYAIGSLSGLSGPLLAEFDTLPTGITDWTATGNTLGNIALVLEPNRRVRFQFLPEPGTLAIFAIGLLGLGLLVQRQRQLAAASFAAKGR